MWDVIQDKMNMDEITFQTQSAHERKAFIKPFRCTTEHTIQQQYCRNGQRDIQHTFHIKREVPMFLLFKENACSQCHQEQQNNHPNACTIQLFLASDHLSHIDSYKEYRNTTPEDFKMSDIRVNRR